MALVDSFAAVIFDYGGVLVKNQSKADQARMAHVVNLPADRFHDLYWNRRAEYDRAELSALDYWQEIAQQGATKLDAKALEELIRIDNESWMQFDDVMWHWVGELRKAGKRVAMLSNMPRDLGEALRAQTTRLGEFDQVTLSFEVRASKPDGVIYEHCLEGLDVAADQALFFDDRIENVQAAELLGMRAMQFLDRDDVLLQVK